MKQEMKETCFNYCYEPNKNDHIGYFSSNETRHINRIHSLAEKYPDYVKILKEPEENFGIIYCSLPQEWLKVSPPKSIDYTEEQWKEIRERAGNNFGFLQEPKD